MEDKIIRVVYRGVVICTGNKKGHSYSVLDGEKLTSHKLLFDKKLHKNGSVGSVHEFINVGGDDKAYRSGKFIEFLSDLKTVAAMIAESEANVTAIRLAETLKKQSNQNPMPTMKLEDLRKTYKGLLSSEARRAMLVNIIEYITV